MITHESDRDDMIIGPFHSSLQDSPLVARQPGDELPGYYQDAHSGAS